jgi:hypothetical protein
VLLTRLPLGIATPFDLHVLGTPPALVLSQDQTLHNKIYGALMMALKLLVLYSNLSTKNGRRPTDLCACCTVQFSRSVRRPNEYPPGGTRSGHDGYHIAADMSCQGKGRGAYNRAAIQYA